MVNNFKKIATGLASCMPETQAESLLGCENCPYNEECGVCEGKAEFISLPRELVMDIREYFSLNRIDSTMVQ